MGVFPEFLDFMRTNQTIKYFRVQVSHSVIESLAQALEENTGIETLDIMMSKLDQTDMERLRAIKRVKILFYDNM